MLINYLYLLMKYNKYIVLLFSICIIGLVGCSNSSKMFRYEDPENEALFIQREFGAKVFILMNNGDEYTGELLRARDNTLILCKKYKAHEEKLSNLVFPIFSVQNHDINIIWLSGENHLIGGIVFGGLTAAVAGGLIGFRIRDNNHSDHGGLQGLGAIDIDSGEMGTGCLIGGGIGMLIGGFIGESFSTDDKLVYEYENSDDYDFTRLNIYARYGDKEPDYLMEIK
jgi:hypothetical protein